MSLDTRTTLSVETTGGVAHVRLTSPDTLNAMTRPFFRMLHDVVTSLSRGGATRALVLSSSGRHFCAGMDLSVFTESLAATPAEAGRGNLSMIATVRHLQAAFTVLETARMPVLVALHGGVIGGAVDLACAADLRYATEDAFFCIAETNVGMAADLGTLQRLGRLIPEGVAREYAFTGRRMPAARAYELGLVQHVYADHDAMLEGVLATAHEIAGKSPLAVHGTKVAMTYARDHGVVEGLEQIAQWQAGMFQSADMTEAFTAKAEKREPVFADLEVEPEL